MQLRIIKTLMDIMQCPKCKKVTSERHDYERVHMTYSCEHCNVELKLIETVVTDVDIESGMI